MHVRALLVAAGVGAGLMYLLDPRLGPRRRALLRDRWMRARHRTTDAVDATSRDVRNRARGVVAELRARLGRDDGAPDHVVGERVRARVGQVIGHARSIDATVQDGEVTLHGPVLEHEAARLVRRVGQVRGVRAVVDRLEVHAEAGDVPGLQGARRVPRGGEVFELMQRNWSPAARLATGLGGLLLALWGLRRLSPVGLPMATLGVALLTRGAANQPLAEILSELSGRAAWR